jgi:hypothetical protein
MGSEGSEVEEPSGCQVSLEVLERTGRVVDGLLAGQKEGRSGPEGRANDGPLGVCPGHREQL